MLTKTRILLSAAIIFGTACTASAAAKHGTVKHHNASGAHAVVRETDPGIITDRCLPTDNPCRTTLDGW
jgi:hypothetical protein